MAQHQIIETGVDKLVSLMKKRGRISFHDAAKELGVSEDVIGEWADFLEEENIVGIEYKLTTPYLIEKKLSKKEVETKAKAFMDKKDIFIRKAEGTLNFLQREENTMRKVKKEFDKLKQDLGIEFETVQKELADIDEFEKKKQEITQRVFSQQDKTKEKLKELNTLINNEQKKYSLLLEEVQSEEKDIESREHHTDTLRKQENIALHDLEHAKKIIQDIEKKISSEESHMEHSENHIKKLHSIAHDFKLEIQKDKKLLDPLIKQKEEQELLIREMGNKLLSKVKSKKKSRPNVSEKFKTFLDKKMKVATLVEKLNKDRQDLQKELEALIKKAKAFQLSSKTNYVDKEIKEIEKKFEEVDKKRSLFEDQFKKLSTMMKLRS